MNLQRVQNLARSGAIEVTRKMLLRLGREGLPASRYIPFITEAHVEDEDVMAHPDFAFSLSGADPEEPYHLVCVQPSDGRCVRIVGRLRKKKKETS